MSKKILIITDAGFNQTNGVVTTQKNIIRELEKDGYIIKTITPDDFLNFKCPFYKEIEIAIPSFSKLKKLIVNFSPDYIHVSTEFTLGIMARILLKKMGYKWNSAFHTRFPEYMEEKFGFGKKFMWSILRKIYKNDNKILVTTDTMKNIMINNGFDENKICLWTLGVDENFIQKNTRNENYNPILLNVGRVSIEKNLEDFYKLKTKGIKIQVGDGPMLNYYKKKYPDVMFVGKKEGKELYNYYKNSDVFVFPSLTDTFGLVMVEAMRCGLPVAAYPVPGPIDVVDNKITGVLDNDLNDAVEKCVFMNKNIVYEKSKKFSWKTSVEIFKNNLIEKE